MSAQFTITVDPARDLVRMTLAGFFTPDSIRAFADERQRAHQRLRCARNRHLTLADVRGMAIQSQEIVTRFQAILADPPYRSRRLGFVTATSLTRMQIQRALGGRDASVFTDPDEAEAWVLAAGPASEAA